MIYLKYRQLEIKPLRPCAIQDDSRGKRTEKILEEMSRYEASTAFPFVKIDGEVVIGYNPRNILS